MAVSGIPELLELRSTNLGSLELEGESKPKMIRLRRELDAGKPNTSIK